MLPIKYKIHLKVLFRRLNCDILNLVDGNQRYYGLSLECGNNSCFTAYFVYIFLYYFTLLYFALVYFNLRGMYEFYYSYRREGLFPSLFFLLFERDLVSG